jgi:hypothetical protein
MFKNLILAHNDGGDGKDGDNDPKQQQCHQWQRQWGHQTMTTTTKTTEDNGCHQSSRGPGCRHCADGHAAMAPSSSYSCLPQNWPYGGIHKNLEQNKKNWTAKIIWIGWPANRSRLVTKMTKKRPCTQSGFVKKRILWDKNLAKKSTKTQTNELRQVPILHSSEFLGHPISNPTSNPTPILPKKLLRLWALRV